MAWPQRFGIHPKNAFPLHRAGVLPVDSSGQATRSGPVEGRRRPCCPLRGQRSGQESEKRIIEYGEGIR